MIRRFFAAALMVLSFDAVGQSSSSPNPAGSFDLVDGDVRVVDSSQRSRPAKVGESVVEGDSIVTGTDAEAHLAMEDGGQLGVRPNTRLRIVKYKAEGGAGDRSTINLLEGTLRSISGWIGKFNPRNYEIKTPTATIGIRGTDHETKVIPANHGEGEAGTYDKVNAGSTVLTTAKGSTEIRPSQAGFVPHFGTMQPKLLDRVPVFFRPARNDKRLEGMHEAIRQRIDRVRDERLRFVRDRRTEFEQRKRGILKQRQQRIRELTARPPARAAAAAANRAQAATGQIEERRREQKPRRIEAQRREIEARQAHPGVGRRSPRPHGQEPMQR